MKLPFLSCSQMSEFEVLGEGVRKNSKMYHFSALVWEEGHRLGQNAAGDGGPINHEIQFQRGGIVPWPFEREEIFLLLQ